MDDGLLVASAGADALGLVFYEPSPRYVSPQTAAEITHHVGPFLTSVGLFVNPDVDFVEQVLRTVPLQLLQFHGDESPAFCEQFNRPYIKAIRMKEGVDVAAIVGQYPSALGVLLDTYRKGVPGGTGETFNWNTVPELACPIVLAGGLSPSNVQQAVQQVAPYGVDVSGGVESQPGKKDANKVYGFIHNVKALL